MASTGIRVTLLWAEGTDHTRARVNTRAALRPALVEQSVDIKRIACVPAVYRLVAHQEALERGLTVRCGHNGLTDPAVMEVRR